MAAAATGPLRLLPRLFRLFFAVRNARLMQANDQRT